MDPDRVRRLAEGLRLAMADAELRADLSDAERLLLRALAAQTAADVAETLGPEAGRPLLPLAAEAPATSGAARAAARRLVGRGLWPYRLAVLVLVADAAMLWSLAPSSAKDDGPLTLVALLLAAVAVALVGLAPLPRVLLTQLGSGSGPLLRRVRTVGEHVQALLVQDVATTLPDLDPADPVPRARSALLESVRRGTRRRVLALAGSLAVLAVVTFLGLVRALGLL